MNNENVGQRQPGLNERQLWRILHVEADSRREPNRDHLRRGAKVTDVLDTAEGCGINRFWATETMMAWLDQGLIRKSHTQNYIVPLTGRLER